MKLHLPKLLRHAVLACVSAVAAISTTVGTAALTGGVVLYAVSAQAQAAFTQTTKSFNVNGQSKTLVTVTGDSNTNIVLPGNTGSTFADVEGAEAVSSMIAFEMSSAVDIAGQGGGNFFKGSPIYSGAVYVSGAEGKGLLINNAGTQTITFEGAFYGEGAISRTGNGSNLKFVFNGDMSNFTGIYRLKSNGSGFEMIFGGTAPATSSTKGALGTGDIKFEINNANNTLRLSYAAATSPVFVTNRIVKADAVTNGHAVKVVVDGGADMVFTKECYIDDLSVTAGTAKFADALTLNGKVTLSAQESVIVSAAAVVTSSAVFDLTAFCTTEGENTVLANGTYKLIKVETGGSISGLDALNINNVSVENLTLTGKKALFNNNGSVTIADILDHVWTGGDLTWTDGAEFSGGSVYTKGDNVTISGVANITIGAAVLPGVVTVTGADTVVTLTNADLMTPASLSVADGAKLVYNVGEGKEVTQLVTAAAGTTFEKTGKGTMVSNLANLAGDLVVSEGTFKSNKAVARTSRKVTVKDGATFDVNNAAMYVSLTLEEGAILTNSHNVADSTTTGTGQMQLHTIELTGDAKVNGTGQLGMVGDGYAVTALKLNSNTLVKEGSNTFILFHTAADTEGTIQIDGGVVSAQTNGTKVIDLSKVDVVANNSGTFEVARLASVTNNSVTNATVKSLSLAQGGQVKVDANSKLTVVDSLTSTGGTISGKIVLSEAVSHSTGTLDISAAVFSVDAWDTLELHPTSDAAPSLPTSNGFIGADTTSKYTVVGNSAGGSITLSADTKLYVGADTTGVALELAPDGSAVASVSGAFKGEYYVCSDTDAQTINADAATAGITVKKIVLDGAKLTRGDANLSAIQLAGEGVCEYGDITANNTLLLAAVASDWSGTVKFSGCNETLKFDLSKLSAIGTKTSKVQLTAFYGYLSGATLSSNLILDNGDAGYAIRLNNGTSSGDASAIFSGSIEGSGNIEYVWLVQDTAGERWTVHEFSGDTSQWDGKFIRNITDIYDAGDTAGPEGTTKGKITDVKFTRGDDVFKAGGNGGVEDKSTAPETNVIIEASRATNFNGSITNVASVAVNSNTSFMKDVSTKALTLGADVTATLVGNVTTDELTMEAGSTLAFAGGTLTTDATLALDSITLLDAGKYFDADTLRADLLVAGKITGWGGSITGLYADQSGMVYDTEISLKSNNKLVVTYAAREIVPTFNGGNGSWTDVDDWSVDYVPTTDGTAGFLAPVDSSVSLENASQSVALLIVETGSANTTTLTDGELHAETVNMTSGKLVMDDTAELVTTAINGGAEAVLGGKIKLVAATKRAMGGVYTGGYDNAKVQMSGGSQTFKPGAGLSISGDAGTAILAYDADATMDKIATTGATVVLDRAAGSTLNLGEASTMKGGTLEIQMTDDEIASGTAVITAGKALKLDGTTIVINTGSGSDATVLPGLTEVLAKTTIESDAELDVKFDSMAYSKYYGGVTSKDGELRLIRNTSFYGENLKPETKTGAAGIAMADGVLAALNPQAKNPDGTLAKVLNTLDDYVLNGASPKAADEVGAALAGAGTAVLGMAISGDVERQLKSIRNRTTSMGVDQTVVNPDLPYYNAWFNAEGDQQELTTSEKMGGYKLNTWGGTVGFDVDLCNTFTAGMALTAMMGDLDVTSEDSTTGDLNTYYVSAFARVASGAWSHTFIGTVGMADISLNRTVAGDKIEGDTDAMSFGLMYETGRVIALDEDGETCIQPVFNVAWRHSSMDSYKETGSDAALEVGEQTMNTVTFGLGARLQTVAGQTTYNRTCIFECRAMAKVDAGDRSSTSEVKLAGLKASMDSQERGAVGLEAGAGLIIPVGDDSGAIFVDGSVDIRADYTNMNGSVGYRVNF